MRGQKTPGVSQKAWSAAQTPGFLARTLAKGLWGWAGEVAIQVPEPTRTIVSWS